jgi:hypothetical protein
MSVKHMIIVRDIRNLSFTPQAQSTPENIEDIEEYVNMQTKIAHIIQGSEFNMEMEQTSNFITDITYTVVTPKYTSITGHFFEPMEGHNVEEIKEGYILRNGRYFRINGKYKTFAKKTDAISNRLVWEYSHKIKALKAEINKQAVSVTDEATLIHQESMSVTEEGNEYHMGPQPIRDVLNMIEGTNVVIQGEVMEYKEFNVTSMAKKKLVVRYFRIGEWETYTDEQGDLIRRIKHSIWVKPGVRVSMMIGTQVTIHGSVKRMPVAQPKGDLTMFLTDQEIWEGLKTFTYLSPARFVKFVPEDITGKTGDVSVMSEEELVQDVLKGYVYSEVVDPNELSRNPADPDAKQNAKMESHFEKLYGWGERMLKINKPRPWLKANLTDMGGGVDELYTKIANAEEYIGKVFDCKFSTDEDKKQEGWEQNILDLMSYLAENELTGDDTEEVSFKDQDGVQRFANSEIMSCIEEIEKLVFADERLEYFDKAMVRLNKHITWEYEGDKVIPLDGFLKSLFKMPPDWRAPVLKAIEEMDKSVVAMKASLKETKWTGEKVTKKGEGPKVQKVYEFNDGIEWYENTVKPVAEEAISKILLTYGEKYGVKYLAKWIKDGIENIASMKMRNEFVPMTKSEIKISKDRIWEAASKIKFYGGPIAGELWRYFSSWQAIKQAQAKEAEGSEHVDNITKGGEDVRQKQHKEQMDAEAKQISWLGWRPAKWDRE